MIRKFATIDAPVGLVREVFADAGSWHRWMPGVTGLRIVEESSSLIVVEFDQVFGGRTHRQVMECRPHPAGMSQHQRSGWFQRWDAEWSFFAPPDGRGTTVSCELEIEAGFIGLISPRRFLQRIIDRGFGEIIDCARLRVRALLGQRATAARADRDAEVLLQVFETANGLEVVIAGRRFVLAAAQSPREVTPREESGELRAMPSER